MTNIAVISVLFSLLQENLFSERGDVNLERDREGERRAIMRLIKACYIGDLKSTKNTAFCGRIFSK